MQGKENQQSIEQLDITSGIAMESGSTTLKDNECHINFISALNFFKNLEKKSEVPETVEVKEKPKSSELLCSAECGTRVSELTNRFGSTSSEETNEINTANLETNNTVIFAAENILIPTPKADEEVENETDQNEETEKPLQNENNCTIDDKQQMKAEKKLKNRQVRREKQSEKKKKAQERKAIEKAKKAATCEISPKEKTPEKEVETKKQREEDELEQAEKLKQIAEQAEIEKQQEMEQLNKIPLLEEIQKLKELYRQKELEAKKELEKLKETERLKEIERSNEIKRFKEISKQRDIVKAREIERLKEIEKQKENKRQTEIKKLKEQAEKRELEWKQEIEKLKENERIKELERLKKMEEQQQETARQLEIEQKKNQKEEKAQIILHQEQKASVAQTNMPKPVQNASDKWMRAKDFNAKSKSHSKSFNQEQHKPVANSLKPTYTKGEKWKHEKSNQSNTTKDNGKSCDAYENIGFLPPWKTSTSAPIVYNPIEKPDSSTDFDLFEDYLTPAEIAAAKLLEEKTNPENTSQPETKPKTKDTNKPVSPELAPSISVPKSDKSIKKANNSTDGGPHTDHLTEAERELAELIRKEITKDFKTEPITLSEPRDCNNDSVKESSEVVVSGDSKTKKRRRRKRTNKQTKKNSPEVTVCKVVEEKACSGTQPMSVDKSTSVITLASTAVKPHNTAGNGSTKVSTQAKNSIAQTENVKGKGASLKNVQSECELNSPKDVKCIEEKTNNSLTLIEEKKKISAKSLPRSNFSAKGKSENTT